MGKLNTILEKIVSYSGASISQIIEKASKGAHGVTGSQPVEVEASHDLDIHEVVERCRDEIQASVDTGRVPSPKYFEQVAILSRKARNYVNEIAICEMYIELINQFAADKKLTEAEVSVQLLPKCALFVKRLHNAKIMSVKS